MSKFQNQDASDIRALRGRIEWRHPQDSKSTPPIMGWCKADQDWWEQWHVLWTPDSNNGLGGMSWTRTIGNFTSLDEAAERILEFVSSKIAAEEKQTA